MSQKNFDAPPRFADKPRAGDADGTVEALAGDLFRSLQEPPHFPAAASRRIEARLAGSRQSVTWQVRRFAIVAAGLVIFLGAGTVAAKYQPAPLQRLLSLFHLSAPHRKSTTVPAAHVGVEVTPMPSLPDVPTTTAETQDREPSVVRNRVALRDVGRSNPTRTAAAPGEAAPAPVSALAAESALLGQALAQLHKRHQPAAALETLDAYATKFPSGVLSFDALGARVDALVQLGRKDEALRRLDAVPPAALGQSPALRLLRGELRASAGQLVAAIADFDSVLTNAAAGSNHGSDLAERALYGRGSCRARSGDNDRAREDLELYLQRYPAGHFASEARRSLGR